MKRLAILFVLAACNTGEKKETVAAAPVTTQAKSSDKFGVAVTEPITPLKAILESPGSFKGKTIATSGKVTKVCTHQGCWMAIGIEGDKNAMVRMHGHSFFVPPNSSTVGRTARVQGSVVLMKDGKECEGMDTAGAELEFDATGVELDPIS
jgi:hypothetical protein